MDGSKAVFTICVDDVQGVAMNTIQRTLTDDELEEFISRFELGEWSDYVDSTIQDIVHE